MLILVRGYKKQNTCLALNKARLEYKEGIRLKSGGSHPNVANYAAYVANYGTLVSNDEAFVSNDGILVANNEALVANDGILVVNNGAFVANDGILIANNGAFVCNILWKFKRLGWKVQNIGAKLQNIGTWVANTEAKVANTGAKVKNLRHKVNDCYNQVKLFCRHCGSSEGPAELINKRETSIQVADNSSGKPIIHKLRFVGVCKVLILTNWA